jgi:hypothetical protein
MAGKYLARLSLSLCRRLFGCENETMGTTTPPKEIEEQRITGTRGCDCFHTRYPHATTV